jgi:ankyrin repeat protein
MKKLLSLIMVFIALNSIAQDQQSIEERLAKVTGESKTPEAIIKHAITTNDVELFNLGVDKAGSDIKKLNYSFNRMDVNKGSMFLNATPLMHAAAVGNLEMVKILIEKKVSLKETCKAPSYSYGITNNKGGNANGITAIYFAIQQGHKEVVQALIDAGADIMTISLEVKGRDAISCTPKQWAKLYNQTEIEELLKSSRKFGM